MKVMLLDAANTSLRLATTDGDLPKADFHMQPFLK